ncbi:hypothetical protein [Vagococcus hydrophili]|uniref:Replication protein n=1 Tax=Vagococcus hydrophili TaxID=2714947 RepID=A0A6G8ARK3_9ENTE|nr:hypothetical protein [Vagococcus hydrophili]QIL47555.1 hypothetical protein G7082_02890 [Vagococcus hydrophili]
MSKLLIDDYPIQVLPKLAKEIGLNEAIFIQQVHYWIEKSNHVFNGKKWIYNTYEGWNKQFPFWSVMTIRRTISSLIKKELVITGNFNKAGFDKTKWYSINYETLNCMNNRCVQNEQTSSSNRTDGVVQNEHTNTIDYTETTTETTNNNQSSSKEADSVSLKNKFDEIWEQYPKGRKQGKDKSFKAYQRAIKDGVTDEKILEGLSDYKKQIEIQRTELKFVRQAVTWFVNKGWQDEYLTSNVTSNDKPEVTYIPPEWREEFKDVGKSRELESDYMDDLPF